MSQAQAMLQLFACILMHSGGGPITRFGIILIALAIGGVMLVGICGDILNKWIKRTRGRNWPTISAVVDIASVAFCHDDVLPYSANSYHPYYLATLTYIYQNPEQQMGEYRRRFGDKDEARAWANSYKGETLKVHVDPRDPTRSVLREEDL
jgi:hypothetical protein